MSAFVVANIGPLMFAMLIILLMIGYPVAFSLSANGLLFGAIAIHYGLLGPELIQARARGDRRLLMMSMRTCSFLRRV